MITKVTHVSVLAPDQDQAIQWYTEVLGFKLTNDQAFGVGGRWVTVKAQENSDLEIVLHKPWPGQEFPPVTHYVFGTDDCRQEVARLKELGVTIIAEPEVMMYGIQAIFADPFGNTFVLVESRPYQA